MSNMNGRDRKLPWLTPHEALNRQFSRQAGEMTRAVAQVEFTRRLGFRIGNIGLLIGEHATSELSDMLAICPIPNTATWLVGIINLRGNLVPVFDLNGLLKIAQGSERTKMLLIFGEGETAGAVIIYDYPRHVTLTEEDKLETLPPLPDVLSPFATVGYEKEGQLWFNFDHMGFFQAIAPKVAA